ncbi:MAG TPA: response regulator [Myxococcaceae bacterium]|nr:response regulator [Myxococcaceae bacterium]
MGTVLICDDEPLVASALARLATRAGLTPIIDTSSQQVVELAKQRRPDVIILDVRQRIDGRDLLASLKRDPETRDIKVVMLSAVEDQFMRRVCLELGAADYEVKPFDGTFMTRIKRLAGDAPLSSDAPAG